MSKPASTLSIINMVTPGPFGVTLADLVISVASADGLSDFGLVISEIISADVPADVEKGGAALLALSR